MLGLALGRFGTLEEVAKERDVTEERRAQAPTAAGPVTGAWRNWGKFNRI